mgnify:CR=1 FL=1
MANLGMQFNSSEVDPNQFDVIPKNDYTLRIVDSSVVDNSSKTGQLLKLTLEVVDGQYANRKVFDQINLSNPSEMAVKIGRERLSAYCHAVGVTVLNDSQQLHGIPFTGKVVIKTDPNGQYDDRNEIRTIKKLEGGVQNGGFAQGGFNGQPNGFNQGSFAPAQGGGFNQGQAQGQGYGQFQNQGQQPNNQNFQPQGQGFGQAQGQPQNQGGFNQPANTAQQPGGTYAAYPDQGQPQNNFQPQNGFNQGQAQGQVDNSAVPPMEMQNQGQQPNNQGFNQDQGQAQGQKAPWEQ